MSVLKIIAVVLVAVVAIVLFLAATKPATFRVERKLVVQAGVEKIFPRIADFHQWTEWSPWEGLDTGMTRKYSGTEKGVGAVYEWEGNGKVGAGRMELVQVQEPTKIVVKLDFIRPFEGHNTTEFTLQPQGESTLVTWAMFGPNRYLAKVMQVFCDMDKMIGKDFEKGLGNLKAIAEK